MPSRSFSRMAGPHPARLTVRWLHACERVWPHCAACLASSRQHSTRGRTGTRAASKRLAGSMLGFSAHARQMGAVHERWPARSAGQQPRAQTGPTLAPACCMNDFTPLALRSTWCRASHLASVRACFPRRVCRTATFAEQMQRWGAGGDGLAVCEACILLSAAVHRGCA